MHLHINIFTILMYLYIMYLIVTFQMKISNSMFMYIRLALLRFYILGGGVVETRILKKNWR